MSADMRVDVYPADIKPASFVARATWRIAEQDYGSIGAGATRAAALVDLAAQLARLFDRRPEFEPGYVQRCRRCGCTDADCTGCVERTGEPCTWVRRDLCSACAS